MNGIKISFYLIFVIMSWLFQIIDSSFNCILPPRCRIGKVHAYQSFYANEKNFRPNMLGIRCDIDNDEFQIGYNVSASPLLTTNEPCFISDSGQDEQIVELKWLSTSRHAILDNHFGIHKLLVYSDFFKYNLDLTFVNVNGFDLNLVSNSIGGSNIGNIVCLRCTFNFYINRTLVSSCNDITTNSISSIFQLEFHKYLILADCEFRGNICPKVFNNSYIPYLIITGLIDSFYKTSIIRFSNLTSASLNSTITEVEIFSQDVSLDLNLLNPLVFQMLRAIVLKGSVKSIDSGIFKSLKGLYIINFETIHFRKLVHRNGIEWIKQINSDLNVNLSDWDDIERHFNFDYIRLLALSCEAYKHEERMSRVFPDEDFCLYADYPFDQLVILFQLCTSSMIPLLKTTDYSCTYLWITRFLAGMFGTIFTNDSEIYLSAKLISDSDAFNSIEKCDFNRRFSLCHKYRNKDILGISDFVVFNKIVETIFKILTYITCLFGLAANILVILVICHTCNKEIFNGFKQYSYLWINSGFSLLILIVEILSWISECFYPFEVFCPATRKLVAIQFLRIILKECFVTSFRFMSSFCYVAFALNRISLIGRDHGIIVKFISDVKVLYFILVTMIISIGLSVVKYFKYEVNYDEFESTFPVSNEWDILDQSYLTFHNFAYFTINTISDLLNYVVFVLVCFIMDVCMVVQLRRTLNEKIERQNVILKNSENKKKKENEDIVKKVIKMVVLNTTIAIVFKIPSSFLPVLNLCADFYFRKFNERYANPAFGEFYIEFIDGEFYAAIQAVSTFLYCLSLSIQVFIYLVFDKKFKSGYDNFKIVVLNRKASKNNAIME